MDFGLRLSAQAFAQVDDVRAEVGKVLGDAKRPVGDDVQAYRLALRIAQPENLRQRDVLIVSFVVEMAEDHRVAVLVAQRNRLCRQARLAALGLEIAEHVGAQRAFARLGAGRLVVSDALSGHQQGRDCIDQGRFAGTDVAGQKAVVAVGRERPDSIVERAPVVDLTALQAKARPLIGGRVVQAQLLRCFSHSSIPRGRLPGAR